MAINKKEIFDNALVGEILDIDKLCDCNDFETIKEGLNNYPLSINEYLDSLFKKNKQKEIFQFAIDLGLNDFAYWFAYKKDDRSFEEQLESNLLSERRKGKSFINDKWFFKNPRSNSHCDDRVFSSPKTREEVVDSLLSDLSLQIDKKTLTEGLTKEYFDTLFGQENYELLAIKLCVMLEAILKCDFHYQGTFEEMLSRYSKEKGSDMDEDGNWFETEESQLFHKLRKYRNAIVHAEKQSEKLAPDEIRKLIDYVYKLG